MRTGSGRKPAGSLIDVTAYRNETAHRPLTAVYLLHLCRVL